MFLAGYIKMVANFKLGLIISILLLLIGVAVPLLMVVGVMKSNFIILFVSYACSVSGLVLGTITVLSFVKSKRGE